MNDRAKPSNDEHSIQRLLALAAMLLDRHRFRDLAELHAEDAAVIVGGGEPVRGRAAIEAMLREANDPNSPKAVAKGPARHHVSPAVIDVDGATARAWSELLFLNQIDGRWMPAAAASYCDRLVKDGERWLLSERRVIFPGDDSEATAPPLR
ncbi:hypothetical protein MCAG_00114 [Micromonospora sp. ATCC 39149]|uniref:Nuclear transport factor 2 family protein n=1 Tax=Micromonospora carbonacea TaxID=47853 RepID=A0A7D5Y675_9ACTN|nr:nuclear transport factor 2 family protein [Micromonospora sp. ATCC 39149]EEP69787.1 hypothetical protein MCAG_00114 [Micromonospora sp. ATCC 39149]QLJ96259.1 nuclear transport factor 2 family protein [Micromonospora carbonacea]